VAELLWLPVTVAAYLFALALRRRTSSPLANPTLIAIATLVAVLAVTDVGYDHYRDGTGLISALLGPAVVAIAVPLHRRRETLLRHGVALGVGTVVGVLCAIVVGWLAAQVLDLAPAWALAVESRSATAPITIALADELHGIPSLSAVMSILTGVAGATLGPMWLTLLGVGRPMARGLAHGVASHGIGTARMFEENELAGATASVGMGLGGLAVAVLVPLGWS
jgi:predicted murein hydrolase (TIGR00659 family)